MKLCQLAWLLLAAIVAANAVDLKHDVADNFVLTASRAAFTRGVHEPIVTSPTRVNKHGHLLPFGETLFLSFRSHGRAFRFQLDAAHHLLAENARVVGMHSDDTPPTISASTLYAYEGRGVDDKDKEERCHLTMNLDGTAHAQILVDGASLFTLDHHTQLRTHLESGEAFGTRRQVINDGAAVYAAMAKAAAAAVATHQGHVVHTLHEPFLHHLPWGFVDFQRRHVVAGGERFPLNGPLDAADTDADADVDDAGAAGRKVLQNLDLDAPILDFGYGKFQKWVNCFDGQFDTGKNMAVTMGVTYEWMQRMTRWRSGIGSKKQVVENKIQQMFSDANVIFSQQFHLWLKLTGVEICESPGEACAPWNLAEASGKVLGIHATKPYKYLRLIDKYRKEKHFDDTGVFHVLTDTQFWCNKDDTQPCWVGGMANIEGACKKYRHPTKGNGSGWSAFDHYPLDTFVHEMGHSLGSNHPFGIAIAGTYPGKTVAKLLGLPAMGETGGIMDYGNTKWKGKYQFASHSREGICELLQKHVVRGNYPKYVGRCRDRDGKGSRVHQRRKSPWSETCVSNHPDASWVQYYANAATKNCGRDTQLFKLADNYFCSENSMSKPCARRPKWRNP